MNSAWPDPQRDTPTGSWIGLVFALKHQINLVNRPDAWPNRTLVKVVAVSHEPGMVLVACRKPTLGVIRIPVISMRRLTPLEALAHQDVDWAPAVYNIPISLTTGKVEKDDASAIIKSPPTH